MICMTKNQFDVKLAKLQRRNETIEYKRRLREERLKYWPKFIMPSTSKIVLFVSGVICIDVLMFCKKMITATGDTNALYAMVTALFTFMGIVLGYFVKSTRENTRHGITFETAMAQIQKPIVENDSTTEEAVG